MTKNNLTRSYIYLIILLTSVVQSCISPVENVDIPKGKPKLVVGCFISPQDTIIKTTLTTSFPVGTVVSGNGLVTDATVILSDGTSSINLNYTDSIKSYSVPGNLFTISPGKTYYLTINTPSGLSAKAQCTIPANKNTSLDFTIDSTQSTSNGYTSSYYLLKPTWIDIAGEVNYYRMYAELESNYTTYPYYNSFYSNNDESDIYNDVNRDGQKIIVKNLQAYNSNYYTPTKVNAFLLTTDKNYYEFQRTSTNYSDDPFSDPVNIYTNIEGGLGVFAGYQSYKVSKIIK